MLPDEIIQQKEWNELSVEEKELIADLAINAEEFYMMKSMLQLSKEAADDVPQLSAAVKERIDEQIVVKKTFRLNPFWYAAAAVVIIAIAIPSVLKLQKQTNEIAGTEVNSTISPKLQPKKDSSLKEPNIAVPNKVDDKKLADQQIKKNQNSQLNNIDNQPTPEPTLVAQVSSSVTADLSLLDFVTEVE